MARRSRAKIAKPKIWELATGSPDKDRHWLAPAREALRPPDRMPRSKWADKYYRLGGDSANPGKWKCIPYQVEILDCMGDPTISQLSFMKSSRTGGTEMENICIGYFSREEPYPLMMVQPTVHDAEDHSKTAIEAMISSCPRIAEAYEGEQTILIKTYPGGTLRLIGANSPTGFRRVSARIVIFDEIDGYKAAAGPEGDQYRLGTKRTETFWNAQSIAVSTPTLAATSRISALFNAGDQRRYHVPCPHCGHLDILVFREDEHGRGHYMEWPEGHPEAAYFRCKGKGCAIEHKSLRDMLAGGRWIADAEFKGHASFHVWAAYSPSPGAAWGKIAERFEDAELAGVEAQKTVVNTDLGEVWHEKGDAPDWEKLYQRRLPYPIGTVPEGVKFLTCGVDVAPVRGRFDFEVVGWDYQMRSWSIAAGEIYGPIADRATWDKLDELLNRQFPCTDGSYMPIRRLAIDSGAATNTVYNWARRYGADLVMATKGKDTPTQLVSAGKPIDVTVDGRVWKNGVVLFIIGTDVGKGELFGWLKLEIPEDGEPYPPGWCHFPEYGQDFFKQVCSEQLVVTLRKGYPVMVYRPLPNQENHKLDCRIGARAAAQSLGLDRVSVQPPAQSVVPPKPAPRAEPREGWLNGGQGRGRRGKWL